MTKHCKTCKCTTYHKKISSKATAWIIIICNKCKNQVGVM